MHRVLTVETWVNRLIKLAPIDSIAMELVSFDTQKMVNPEVSGVEYQLGGKNKRQAPLHSNGSTSLSRKASKVTLSTAL